MESVTSVAGSSTVGSGPVYSSTEGSVPVTVPVTTVVVVVLVAGVVSVAAVSVIIVVVVVVDGISDVSVFHPGSVPIYTFSKSASCCKLRLETPTRYSRITIVQLRSI